MDVWHPWFAVGSLLCFSVWWLMKDSRKQKEVEDDLEARAAAILLEVDKLINPPVPKTAMNYPDVFQTNKGSKVHALRYGTTGLKSYCGLETTLTAITGEGLVTCQSCLRGLASSDFPEEGITKVTKAPTAWERLNDDDYGSDD